MVTVTVHHASLTGAAANPNVLVDGPKWDAEHTTSVSGLENVDNTSDVNKPVSTAQAAAIAAATTARPVDVTDGDSLSYYGAGGVGLWPQYLAANHAFFQRGTFVSYAVPGDTTAAMAARYAAGMGGLDLSQFGEKRSHFWGGTNDAVSAVPSATTYANQKTRWAADRLKGCKVVAYTLMQRGDASGAQNAVITATNALILSDRTLYDYLVRPDLYFTNTADTTIFIAPGVHLTAAANVILAQKVAEVVLGTNQNSWIPYLPVVTPDGGAFVSVTPTGKINVRGNTFDFVINIAVGAAGIGTATGGITVTVPFTFPNDQHRPFACHAEDVSLNYFARGIQNTNSIYILNGAAGGPIANSRVITISGTSERA